MNFAVQGLTVFGVVIAPLQVMPLGWTVVAAVVSLCAFVLVVREMRRAPESQEDRVTEKQPAGARDV
jgi:hypothetical protein